MSQTENQVETHKEKTATLKNLLSVAGKILHMLPESIDYQVITDGMKELSGAWVVGLNTHEEGGTKSVTRAFSGVSSAIKQASKILGFPLTGKEWDVIPERVRNLQGCKLVQYNSLYETSMGAISKTTAQVLERIFNIGYVYVIGFSCGRRESLGDMIIFMKKGEKIKNREAIEIYADLIDSILMRVKTEKELQESEAKFRAYMENSPLGVFVANREGHYVEVNRAACQMSGYTEEELLNLTIPDFLSPEFLEKGMKFFERLLKESHAEDDVMVRKKNGETFWINLAAVTIDSNRVIAFCRDITARKDAEESLKYQLGFAKMLADISSTFASQPSERLEQNINHALEQIGEFFKIERSYVFQYSDDGKQMSNTYEWCAEGNESQADRLQDVPLGLFPWWVEQIRNKQYLNIPDVDGLPPEAVAEREEFKSQGIRSLLAIPMIKNGIVFGFLGLDAVKEKKVWTENQVMLLMVVTELISNAYTRKLTEEKIRYQSFHDGLTGLFNRGYLEKEMERLDTERQLPIGIIMADLNGLKLANDSFGHEAGDEMLKKTAEILRNSCRGEDIIARWGGDEFVIFLPQTTAEGAKAICQRIDGKSKRTYVEGIPLSLAVGSAIKNSTSQDLAEILKEAEESMYKHKLAESQRAKSAVLKRLLKNLEAKSFETETHYSVMQNVAQKIGKKIGLSQSELKRLKLLIPLHDIGKINIPEGILKKKGPLTAEEWEIIKKHPETGYRIVHATKEFAHVAEDILSHHERWDGSGYLQGLKGKEIPLLARITAVADAYEVMSSGRSYKKAMSGEEIVAELKRCAGSQFDPELIAIFLLFLEAETND